MSRQAVIGQPVSMWDDIHHVGATDSTRIVDRGVLIAALAQSLELLVGQGQHVVLDAPFDGIGRTRLHTGWLESRFDTVDTHIALGDRFGLRVETGYVEGTTRHTILTSNTVLLVEVDNAILILDDGAGCWAREQATRLLAVKAGVLLINQCRSSPSSTSLKRINNQVSGDRS